MCCLNVRVLGGGTISSPPSKKLQISNSFNGRSLEGCRYAWGFSSGGNYPTSQLLPGTSRIVGWLSLEDDGEEGLIFFALKTFFESSSAGWLEEF